MIKLKVYNSYSYFGIKNVSPDIVKHIEEIVSYEIKDAHWMRKRFGHYIPDKDTLLRKHYNGREHVAY